MDLLSCQEEPRKPGKHELPYFLVQNGLQQFTLCTEGRKEACVGVERTRYVAISLPQGSRFLNLAGVMGQCLSLHIRQNKGRLFFQESAGKSRTYRHLKGEGNFA